MMHVQYEEPKASVMKPICTYFEGQYRGRMVYFIKNTFCGASQYLQNYLNIPSNLVEVGTCYARKVQQGSYAYVVWEPKASVIKPIRTYFEGQYWGCMVDFIENTFCGASQYLHKYMNTPSNLVQVGICYARKVRQGYDAYVVRGAKNQRDKACLYIL